MGRWMVIAAALGLGLTGCGYDFSGKEDETFPDKGPFDRNTTINQSAESEGIFGGNVLDFDLGGKKDDNQGIGVNSFLWRASLDTLGFMPLASADPFGGVIITEWYVNPDVQDERFKVTVFILDKALRADGIKVSVFRQEAKKSGWVDAKVADDTPIKLENAILNRARQLKLETVGE